MTSVLHMGTFSNCHMFRITINKDIEQFWKTNSQFRYINHFYCYNSVYSPLNASFFNYEGTGHFYPNFDKCNYSRQAITSTVPHLRLYLF